MVYKCVSVIAPSQLCSKFVLIDSVSTRVTRITNIFCLRTPQCKTQYYQRTFVSVSIKKWSCLSDECRSAQSLAILKKKSSNLAFDSSFLMKVGEGRLQ